MVWACLLSCGLADLSGSKTAWEWMLACHPQTTKTTRMSNPVAEYLMYWSGSTTILCRLALPFKMIIRLLHCRIVLIIRTIHYNSNYFLIYHVMFYYLYFNSISCLNYQVIPDEYGVIGFGPSNFNFGHSGPPLLLSAIIMSKRF